MQLCFMPLQNAYLHKVANYDGSFNTSRFMIPFLSGVKGHKLFHF